MSGQFHAQVDFSLGDSPTIPMDVVEKRKTIALIGIEPQYFGH
jgi:hypothetical protein